MNRRDYRRRPAPRILEIAGKSVEEAVQEAARKLGVKPEDVDMEILEEGRGGFLGIGAREARIKAWAKRSPAAPGRGTDRPQGRDNVARPPREVDLSGRRHRRVPGPIEADQPEAAPRYGDFGGRDRGGRPPRRAEGEFGGRSRRGRDAAAAENSGRPRFEGGRAPFESGRGQFEGRSEREQGGRGGRSSSRADRGDTRPRRAEERPRATFDRGGSSRGPSDRSAVEFRRQPEATERVTGSDRELRPSAAPGGEDLSGVIRDFATGLLQRMGYPAEVDVAIHDDAYELKIRAGDNEETLIGKRGETLEALQHVLSKMASHGREDLIRLRVDVSGYKERRAGQLSDRALEMARQVEETGTAIVTEPLPAAERRVIHRTLSELPNVTTRALGEGLVKRVWIGPANDVEAAVAAAEAAPFEGRSSVDARTTCGLDSDDSAASGPSAADSPEPISWISTWEDESKKTATGADAPEWGRRPKPAKGRRSR